jgi:hypothetical protein
MDDLHRAVVEEKENRSILAEEVERAFGRAFEVRCAPAGAGLAAADAALAPADAAGAAARVPDKADVNQMIERAVEWFAGEAVMPSDRGRPRSLDSGRDRGRSAES